MPAKRIRVCTGAEMKKICPPKLCDCPPKKKKGFFACLMQLFALGFKILVAGGIVYISYDAGIWGDSEQTERLYGSFCQTFLPLICPDSGVTKKKKLPEVCMAEMELMCVVSRIYLLWKELKVLFK